MAKGRRAEAPRAVPVGLIAGIVAGVLAIGLIAGLSYYRHLDSPCTPTGLHEHSAFSVFIHNQSVEWLGPRWNYGAGGTGSLAGHIHQPNAHTIHMESATDCITLRSFMAATLATQLSNDRLVLDDIDHGGRSVTDGDGGELRFFLGKPIDWTFDEARAYQTADQVAWEEAPNLPRHQPRDGEYLLITFSALEGEALEGEIGYQQKSIPIPIRAE